MSFMQQYLSQVDKKNTYETKIKIQEWEKKEHEVMLQMMTINF